MVSIRPDWQERLAELYSGEAVLERAQERAADIPDSPTPSGGRPTRILTPDVAAQVLLDLGRYSYRKTGRIHEISDRWLREAHRDGRLEAMADGQYS